MKTMRALNLILLLAACVSFAGVQTMVAAAAVQSDSTVQLGGCDKSCDGKKGNDKGGSDQGGGN